MMLQSFLHNPNVKSKMKLEEFIKNTREPEPLKNLSDTLLTSIYQSIKEEKFLNTTIFPHAIKQGYLLYEKRSRTGIRVKNIKLFWVLDKESRKLLCFAREPVKYQSNFNFWCTNPTKFLILKIIHCFQMPADVPIKKYDFQYLKLKKNQDIVKEQGKGLFPFTLTYSPPKSKLEEIKLLAASSRLWVDWVTIFSEL